MPAFTAVPTASAVCATGAAPVLVDVDAATATIDPAAVAAAITDRTRAIVVVHLYGRPAPVGPLLELGVPVVEDAAQAHGALCGVSGIAAVYSFYPTKNVGGIGDGGAVVTADADLAATVRRRRGHGLTEQLRARRHQPEPSDERARSRLAAPAAPPPRRRQPPPPRDRPPLPRRCARAALARRRPAPRRAPVRRARRPSGNVCARCSSDRGVATAMHYPLALTQQPAYRHFVRHAVPGGRGVGCGVRLAAVLPRADRRRGRGRGGGTAGDRVTPRNPEVRSVSAFFPCYNDALSIPKMVHDVHGVLAAAVDDFEIIVVDDGSSDDSVAVLHALPGRDLRAARRRARTQPGLRRGAALRLRRGQARLGLLHRRRRPVRRVRADPLHRRRPSRRRHRPGLQARAEATPGTARRSDGPTTTPCGSCSACAFATPTATSASSGAGSSTQSSCSRRPASSAWR